MAYRKISFVSHHITNILMYVILKKTQILLHHNDDKLYGMPLVLYIQILSNNRIYTIKVFLPHDFITFRYHKIHKINNKKHTSFRGPGRHEPSPAPMEIVLNSMKGRKL